MVISVIVASSAVAFAAVALLQNRRSRARSRSRLERVVGDLDRCLARVGTSLARTVEQSQEARSPRLAELGLTLDLDELIVRLAEEAASRTGAQATGVRVRGPAGEPALACFGSEQVMRLLDSTHHPPGGGPFRALTISWTFPPTLDADASVFRSALVVPIVEHGVETGAIAGCAHEAAAFRPEHARALEALAAEASDAIATARRFTAMRLRATLARSEAETERGPRLRRARGPGDAQA